ncbi:hypothetical protein [Shigella sonnei]|uniref:hypothetical protein n=1 Tax=Shigella sonnei TaxID=624 RepID=UPI00098C552F|nr:hypothetical protein [Shigella sonnei]
MSQIEQQLAQALREVEAEREAMRGLFKTLQIEYEQTRLDNKKLREQVEQLSGQFQQLAQALSTLKRR